MKSYQFFTDDGRGGTMLCDDENLEQAVSELTSRFNGVVRVQIGKEIWQAKDGQIESKSHKLDTPNPDNQNSSG